MADSEPRSIIGKQEDGDFLLAPRTHSSGLRMSAPALADVLEDARMTVTAEQYEEHDDKAIKAQGNYKSLMFRGSLAVFVSAVCGAAMMASELFVQQNIANPYATKALSLLGGAAGCYAGYCLYRLREGRMLETWMGERARAETARIGYFAYLGETAAASQDRSLIALILEYFRRYQLDVQRAFYKNRGEGHLLSANRTVTLGAIGTVIAALANLSGAPAGFWVTFGTLGVVGASLTTFATTREQTNQDRRNAERYGRTRDALDALAAKLTEVRAAAGQGNGNAVKEFIAAVNEQVSLEHRQWLEGSEATVAALAKLEDALRKPPKKG